MQLEGLTNTFDVTKTSGFVYTPKISPRQTPPNAKSIYRKRKVLQEQLDEVMPEYEIVKKKKHSLEEDAK